MDANIWASGDDDGVVKGIFCFILIAMENYFDYFVLKYGIGAERLKNLLLSLLKKSTNL